jgi:hypothetical protein
MNLGPLTASPYANERPTPGLTLQRRLEEIRAWPMSERCHSFAQIRTVNANRTQLERCAVGCLIRTNKRMADFANPSTSATGGKWYVYAGTATCAIADSITGAAPKEPNFERIYLAGR